jgi:mono/diheme cytochrome c family protein
LRVAGKRTQRDGAKARRQQQGLLLPLRRRALALNVLLLLSVPAYADGDVARGKELFALAGGCGCHNVADGTVGSGGREIATPFGTFYGTNITPDRETGIGAWSDAEIIAAIRDGEARGKGVEAPVMPYYQYAGMSDADVRALVAYLRTLPPVRRVNREAEVWLPLPRLAYRAWRLLFAPRLAPPAETPTEPIERGRYLVEHVAICGDCHTPRNRLGAPDRRLYLAGTEVGPDGKPVPNITTDVDTGIGKWREGAILEVLRSGMLPNADNVQGMMAEVVDGYGGPGYSDAPESELRSIAKYMKSVPPVRHQIGD